MSTIKRFENHLSPDDVVDLEFEKERGDVLGFSVNLRSRIGREWREVIRYDTRHGGLHVHRFWRQEEEQIENLDPEGRWEGDYGHALDDAVADILWNWRVHRARLGG